MTYTKQPITPRAGYSIIEMTQDQFNRLDSKVQDALRTYCVTLYAGGATVQIEVREYRVGDLMQYASLPVRPAAKHQSVVRGYQMEEISDKLRELRQRLGDYRNRCEANGWIGDPATVYQREMEIAEWETKWREVRGAI